MEKINFSGGEPFLHEKGDFLGKMVQFCKQELQLPSVSIVSNGSMIQERWFQKYGEMLRKKATLSLFLSPKGNKVFGPVQTFPLSRQVTIWTSWPSPVTVSMKTPTS